MKDDKIGSLSHAVGVISLGASDLTIGGQQYSTPTLNRTISTDVTLVANTLYMIYAVVNSGVVDLRISTNVNSAGPAGFSSWKLVGAFYSNGASSVAFGSFVGIEGTPESDWITFDPTGTWVANTSYFGRWKRTGTNLELQFRVSTSGAPTAASLVINFPTNLSVENAVNQLSNNAGYGYAQDTGVANYDLAVLIVTATSIAPVSKGAAGTFVNNANTTNTAPFTWASGDLLDCYATVVGTGFNSRPLKDL